MPRGQIELSERIDPASVVVDPSGQAAAELHARREVVRLDFDGRAVIPIIDAGPSSTLAWDRGHLLIGQASAEIGVHSSSGEHLTTIPTGTVVTHIVALDEHPAALGSATVLTLDDYGLALRQTRGGAELRLFACDGIPMSASGGRQTRGQRSTRGVVAVWREHPGGALVRVGVDDNLLRPWLAPGRATVELESIADVISAFLREQAREPAQPTGRSSK